MVKLKNILKVKNVLLRSVVVMLLCLSVCYAYAQPSDSASVNNEENPVEVVNPPAENNGVEAADKPTSDNPFEIGESQTPPTQPVVSEPSAVPIPVPAQPVAEPYVPPVVNEAVVVEDDNNEPAATVQVVDIAPTAEVEIDTENPFELTAKNRINRSEVEPIAVISSGGATTKPVVKPKKKKPKKPSLIAETFKPKRFNVTQGLQFLVLLFMGIILAFLATIYRDDLSRVAGAFGSGNLMIQLQRDRGNLISFPYLPMYLLFFIGAGALTFLVADFYKIPIVANPFLALFLCILGVTSFFLGKHLLLTLVGLIFPVGKEMSLYNFTIAIFNQLIGLILILFIAIIAFAPPVLKEWGVYGALGVIGLIYLYRSIRSLMIAEKYLAANKFHFILYLCAVEIAPVVILIKLATLWG